MITVYEGNTFPHESDRLEGLMQEELSLAIAECGGYVAGGAITSVFTGREINDIDIYMPSVDMLEKFIAICYGMYIRRNEQGDLLEVTEGDSIDPKPYVVMASEKSVTFSFYHKSKNYGTTSFQVIAFDVFPTPQDIFDRYDYTINMGAYHPATKTFHFDHRFLKDNSQRHLEFNEGTEYPIISLLRVGKYQSRGYEISKKSMLKLGIAISGLDINSWEEAKRHLSGMYGTNVDELFDNQGEFDKDKLFKVIENAQNKYIQSISTSQEKVTSFFSAKDELQWNYFGVIQKIRAALGAPLGVDNAYMVIPSNYFTFFGNEDDLQLGSDYDKVLDSKRENGKQVYIGSEVFITELQARHHLEDMCTRRLSSTSTSGYTLLKLSVKKNKHDILLGKDGSFAQTEGYGFIVEELLTEVKNNGSIKASAWFGFDANNISPSSGSERYMEDIPF